MLWLLEVARPSLHLRENFRYQVIPLETVHVVEDQNIVIAQNYRASKRSELLAYEKVLSKDNQEKVLRLIDQKIGVQNIVKDMNISLEQKQVPIRTKIIYELSQNIKDISEESKSGSD